MVERVFYNVDVTKYQVLFEIKRRWLPSKLRRRLPVNGRYAIVRVLDEERGQFGG